MLSRSAFRSATQLSLRQSAFGRGFRVSQFRPSTTSATSKPEAQAIIASQRLRRPISPHLTIYEPQLTWYMSSVHRVTGVALAGSIYLFGLAYAAAPLAGWHLESASIAASFASLPIIVKVATKFTISVPFFYHAFNGCRHLIWDTAKEMTMKGVYRTGYAVLGLTALTAGYFSLLV